MYFTVLVFFFVFKILVFYDFIRRIILEGIYWDEININDISNDIIDFGLLLKKDYLKKLS